MDLTKEFPRSPREQMDGIAILPRAIDIARAQLAGTIGDYMYAESGIIRLLLNTLGVTDDEFLDAVRTQHSDEAVLEWVRDFVRPEKDKIEAMNRKLATLAPETDEERAQFQKELEEVDPGNISVRTYVDLIDLQERRIAKTGARPEGSPQTAP